MTGAACGSCDWGRPFGALGLAGGDGRARTDRDECLAAGRMGAGLPEHWPVGVITGRATL